MLGIGLSELFWSVYFIFNVMIKKFIRWFKLKFMADNDRIWYIGYGSNIDEQRFLCYIRGGKPEGLSNEYIGARDRTLPLLNEATVIHHELYFAKHSAKWNGAVSFIKNASSTNVQTYARRYLISKQQFEDIAKQETGSDDAHTINFKEVIAQGHNIFKLSSWYGKIIYLGTNSGYPSFTITNENDLIEYLKPSDLYLKTIGNGIKTVFKLDNKALIDYFATKEGVVGNYTEEELSNIFS